jgi:cyclase
MLKKRIVPCLDVRDGRVVKGVRFEGLRDAGDPAELGRLYARQGADELVFLDITATRRSEATAVRLAERVAHDLFIPFTIGGGLRDTAQMREVLHAGADKVGINTAAADRPALISEAADRFGSQAVVVAIDAFRLPDPAESEPRWGVRVRAGTRETDRDAVEWAREVVRRGAGEILLTSIDRDGTKSGFDLPLLQAICRAVPVPVIASGGAGSVDHFAEAFDAGASAALAASLFHFREIEIPDLKRQLATRGIPVRLTNHGADNVE